MNLRIGILSYHGDVIEHKAALVQASKELCIPIFVVEVRSKKDISNLHALIIPGGESNIMYKLSMRFGIFDDLKKIPCIFGTCAGAIMLSREIEGAEEGQKSLALIDVKSSRNAYGRQSESFETPLETTLGKLTAIFIRAPKLDALGKSIKILSVFNSSAVAIEQETLTTYYLATSFHPELTSTIFHKHFIKKVIEKSSKIAVVSN